MLRSIGPLAISSFNLLFKSPICKYPRKPGCVGALHAFSTRTMSLSKERPPAEVGDSLQEVDTPALVVDLDVFEQNCKKLRSVMQQFPGVNIRVHCKAHKCPPLAQLQLGIVGGRGVCCQKLCEVEAMVEGGIQDVLLSNEIVSNKKIARFVELAKQGAKLSVCVDDLANLKQISQMATEHGVDVGVLVEVNVGQNRCGVQDIKEATTLAKKALELPSIKFKGIQTYQGGLQHVRDPEDRKKAVTEVIEKAGAFVSALSANGIECKEVTGGGSGTYRIEAASRIFTEVQPGSFCFGDVDYSKNVQTDGSLGEWAQSLFVLSTVMSRNESQHKAILDAGLKAVSLDSGPPVPWPTDQYKDVVFQNGGDEHGILIWPQESKVRLPDVGTMVRLIPGHCDPTVNMYDWIVGFRNDKVENVWPVRGRGPGN